MRPLKISSSRGFTLLEALLATLVVTLGFFALLQVFSLGLFASRDNESVLVATQLAQEKMDEIRNKSYASIANEAKAAVTGFSDFQREVVVTTPQTDLKQVSVSVYWNTKSAELNTSLVTYASNL